MRAGCTTRVWAVAAWALPPFASIAPVALCEAGSPVAVREIVLSTPDGEARGYAAVVDLRDPAVEIVVTAPLADRSDEALLTPTDSWARAQGVVVAVNANFFAKGTAAANGDVGADILGLSVSDGRVVSPARSYGGAADPALIVRDDGGAVVARSASTEGVRDAVAGIGASASDSLPGTLLVTDGANTGATARVEPLARHPRTAAGVSADGRTLYLVAIDGRQAGWSVGLTLPELADVLIGLGADDAVNLDGGGSTAFVHQPADGDRIINKPSDGRFRPVANHLGVRLRAASETAGTASGAAQ